MDNDKFAGKYRIPSARAPWWNYGNNGAYFITICTAHRESFFGEIRDEIMYPNQIGSLVEAEWLKTPAKRPDMHLQLKEFQVMPNHFHGIILIGDNEYNTAESRRDVVLASSDESTIPQIESLIFEKRQHDDMTICNNAENNHFGPQRKNLSSILRGFKSAVTSNALHIHSGFGWQERFHDHIIRDEEEYRRIAHYIINNPKNWKGDKFYRE